MRKMKGINNCQEIEEEYIPHMTVYVEKVFNIPPSVYGRHILYMMHDYLR
jgi:hypothetical protein